MDHIPLRCTCGILQGQVNPEPTSGRARCYCKDCQAYARFLGRQDEILDDHGGTDLIATLPAAVSFTTGLDKLACITLTGKGPLRWYATCCRTPVGNTSRNHKVAYVGLVRTCLAVPPSSLDQAFGPADIALNTGSASSPVPATPWATFQGVFKIMGNAAKARLSGQYKDNPFFDPTSGQPIQEPQPLGEDQRRTLYRDTD